MKVCYVTHLPNLTGASQSLLDILSGIRNENVEPVVLLGKHGPIEAELQQRGIPYSIIRYSSEISEKNPIINLIKRVINKLAVNKVKNFLIREHVDLVHNNSLLVSVGMEAAYRAQIPYICHDREFVWEDHFIRLLTEKRQYLLLKHSAVALEISEAVYKKFKGISPDANYIVLRDGIDVDKYYQSHERLLEGDKVEILLAGRIAPGKGQLEAIKAIEILEKNNLQKYHLTIIGGVGSADYDNKIREYVSEHNIKQVSFLVFSDLKELRRKSDIVLVCSTAEALGRVTIESMLAGCLVIGAKAGATEELIIDGETGLFYEVGNPRDLADKIIYAAENSGKMNEIAGRGQASAMSDFDIHSYNHRLAERYKDIVKAP